MSRRCPTEGKLRAALDCLVHIGRPAMLRRGCPRASCIGATRIACDFLREQGIRARALPVAMVITTLSPGQVHSVFDSTDAPDYEDFRAIADLHRTPYLGVVGFPRRSDPPALSVSATAQY